MAGVNVQNSKFCKTILSSHPSKAFGQLDMMRREGRFTDIILVADGRRFPAHRAVLCSCSPYFDRMFQPGFVEQENNEVVLKDFDADTLAVLLEFMYTAKITITEDNAQDILMGANLMLLYDVREAAGEVLGKLIDHHNCLVIRSLASVFSCRDVEARAQNFILERFEIVSQTDEFLKLAAKEVKKFLSMDDIIVKSEESIYECILRWIRVDEENRRTHFDDLVETVRFPLVTEHYLQSEILKNEYVANSPVCQQMIAQSAIIRRNLNLSCNPGGASSGSASPAPDFGVYASTPRLPAYRGSNMLLFLQCSNSSPWLKTPPVLFDFKKTSWSSLPGPSAPCRYREGSCYVFSDNAVFAMGGEYSVEQVEEPGPALGILPAVGLAAAPHQEIRLDRSVYAFSLEDRSWVLHSNMLTPRKRHQAVVLAGKLYVMGGYNLCSQPLDSVEFIDPSHRRSRSNGSASDTSGLIGAGRPFVGALRPGGSYSSLNEPSNQDYYYGRGDTMLDAACDMLHPDLRPVPPQPNCLQSMTIYEDHRRMAAEYMEMQSEMRALRMYKQELTEKLRNGASEMEAPSEEEVAEYAQLKSEKEALLAFREKLAHQLEVMQKSAVKEEPDSAHTTGGTSAGEDWVVVHNKKA